MSMQNSPKSRSSAAIYSSRFHQVPPKLSHKGFRSGSSTAARLTLFSSMFMAILSHVLHSSIRPVWAQ